MKTFIVLFLLVIGFFGFLFFNNGSIDGKKDQNIVKLEDIENVQNIEKRGDIITEMPVAEEAPTAIPEDQTFETIKNILKEASNRKYTPDITLNTYISSYLYTEESKERFKQAICSSFNISFEEFDRSFKKNKMVWDWVNQLRE